MSKRNKQRLQALSFGVVDSNASPDDSEFSEESPKVVAIPEDSEPARNDKQPRASQRRSMLHHPNNAIGRVSTGKQRVVHTLKHPPGRIKPWAGHNRDYTRLNADRCRDLIDGFKRVGHQEFPVLVRKCENDPDYDFEFVYGARRHWTATFLEWDLLIEVRDVTDRQAFILQDMENRDREDVSDYERAHLYIAAVAQYFNGSQKEMAAFLQIDQSNFSKLLDLAKLPQPIIDAYADVRELKLHHGVVYKRLLADASTKKRTLDRARALAAKPLPGKQVLSALKKAGQVTSEPVKIKPKQFGTLVLTKRTSDGRLAIDCKLPAQIDDKALNAMREDFEALLAEVAREVR